MFSCAPVFCLAAGRRLTACKYNEQIWLDIRQFVNDQATKIDISLKEKQWLKVLDQLMMTSIIHAKEDHP